MGRMTYYDIAMKSYKSIDLQFDTAVSMDWYNLFAAECAQIVEKLIKGVLEKSDLPDDTQANIFETHSLRLLTRILHRKYPNTINAQNASWIGDFYFDTKYPGDNFVEVSKYDAEQIRDITKSLAEPLIALYNSLPSNKTNFFGGTS